MVFNPPIVDLLFSFLFLIPGFLTYRIGRYYGKITVPSDGYNKTVYSLIASGGAIAITSIGVTLLTNVSISTIINTNFTLFQWAVFYFGVIVTSCLQGVIVGLGVDKGLRRTDQNKRERVWTLAFNGAEQPIEVRVVTARGEEVHGYVKLWDSVGHGKDILLQYPRKIVDEQENIDSDDGLFIGQYVLLSEEDISHIYFEGDINIDS